MPDSFQSPIHGGEKDPFEKFRVEPIQKDKETKDAAKGTDSELHKSRSSAFAAYVIFLFKRFLELFETSTKPKAPVSTEPEAREHLLLFKAALEILKIEDRSQDGVYLNRLSELWHQLLETSLRFRRSTLFAERTRAFIKEIQRYPEHHEHSLGYYLSEYAGQKWLPFPYMEIIRKLHKQHQKNPTDSLLNRWTQAIDEMIAALQ